MKTVKFFTAAVVTAFICACASGIMAESDKTTARAEDMVTRAEEKPASGDDLIVTREEAVSASGTTVARADETAAGSENVTTAPAKETSQAVSEEPTVYGDVLPGWEGLTVQAEKLTQAPSAKPAETTKATEAGAPDLHQDKHGYAAVKGKTGITAYRNGRVLKKTYLSLVKKKNGMYRVVAAKNKKGVVYHFDKNGVGTKYKKNKFVKIEYNGEKTKRYCRKGKVYSGLLRSGDGKYYYISGKVAKGWQKISGKYYYFSSDKDNPGLMLTNRIIYGDTPYYVDADGVRVTSRDIQLAVSFVVRHSSKSATASQKLYACYSYLWRNFAYHRYYGIPVAADLQGNAVSMFSSGNGNCFRFATTFAYIAKVLGYESRVAFGNISAARGGMTPHGWTEVKTGGYWYMCDPDMQKEIPGVNSYMRTEATYRYRHNCFHRYTLNIRDGSVKWS